ncbi:50S ribosomal protein L23 [Leptospira bourretii]|uniref:Large ribosomal subunit protein uL23 n=10 Tax=Leptospira TaxID=171 RepID=A0A2N0AQU9_9LEPT|nr:MULTISPECIES: 50S ribosomal protein L23 [Leptospira]EMY61130.1 ribosomal protein L23 [Leptospira terpstrae serovar Hualin str. LT 11-33 = ATCC 700639]EMY69433.1 ribosomal protein L23 [Leptospira vanthielii serovar Holland str. Waz Holland = ATCC 700522]EOQ98260.1 ribosomal protein L23 [Leptospira wolbachii serovar Codice str. CDC]MCG6149163.1 50S ribosomal protein L23 [Leptospira levettii]MCW7462895.1 50S ribosomal protein L23 [Leptospira limi]
MNLENVILSPVVTEKSQDLQTIGERMGKRTVKYTFKVHPDANKTLIKQALKQMYNVVPTAVNVAVYRGKMKRFRNMPSPRPHYKKAVVTFADGANLDFAKV